MPDGGAIHRAAEVGFGRAAEAYERGRPSFPADAVETLTEALGLRDGRRVLELGSGTGKLTRSLAPTGATVVGLEPVDAMRRTFRERVPDAPIVGGVAEALPFRSKSFHGAVAAQVFHWLDVGRAVPELARVLRPGARVGLVWNVRDESREWVRALTEAIEPFRAGTPSHRSGAWRAGFDASGAFTELERRSFPYRHDTSRDAVVDRIISISFVAALGEDERQAVADRVRSILRKIGARATGDPVAFPYRTEVWLTTRR